MAGDVLYACLVNADLLRRRDAGVWSDDFVAAFDCVAITESLDGSGTLFMQLNSGGIYPLYRKLLGGSWVLLGNIANAGEFMLSSPNKDECWSVQEFGHGRWRDGVGFTSYFGGGIPGDTVWAFSPTNVLSIGNISTHNETWKFDGVSFAKQGPNFGFQDVPKSIFSPDGVALYVGAGGLNLFKTLDQGLSWAEVGPGLGGSGESWSGIWGTSQSDLWITYRTTSDGNDAFHWNGSVWTGYKRNGSGGNSFGLVAVSGTASDDVFFAHSNTGIVSRWNGASFDTAEGAGETTGGGTFVGKGTPLLGVPALITIDSVADPIISAAGGDRVTVVLGGDGLPQGTDVQVRFGGVLAYGGQGFGYVPQVGAGNTISAVAPPLPEGLADVSVTIVSTSEEIIAVDALTVLARNWPGSLFSARKSFARWHGVGSRNLEDEN
jgi:hypothetical protein